MDRPRITNVDTLSALFDRLVTERIKWFFFDKEGQTERANHQLIVVGELKKRISDLLHETLTAGTYDYLAEHRTFDESVITEELDELVINDVNIGESDRARLALALTNEKRLRKSNEGRARNKNRIDSAYKSLLEKS